MIFLARILGPDEFSCIAILLVIIILGDVFVQGGFTVSIIQSKKESKEICSSIFWIELAIAIAFSILLYVSSTQIATFFSNTRLEKYICILVLIFPLNASVSIQIALLTRKFEFRKLCLASFVSNLFPTIIAVFIAIYGHGVYAFLFQQIVAKLILFSIFYIFGDWRPTLSFCYISIRDHVKFATNIFVARFISTAYSEIYSILVGRFYSATQLSFFSFGKKIPQTLWGFLDGTLQSVLLPALSKQPTIEDVKKRLRFSMTTSVYLVTFAMSLMYSCAGSIIELVFGREWLGATDFFKIYCILAIINTLTTNNLQAIYATGHSGIILRLELVKKPIGFAILVWTLWRYNDPVAISIGELVYSIIAVLINMYPNKNIINYRYKEQALDVGYIFLVGLLSVTLTVYVVPIGIGSFLSILISGLVFSLSFVLLSYLFGLGALKNSISIINALTHNARKSLTRRINK